MKKPSKQTSWFVAMACGSISLGLLMLEAIATRKKNSRDNRFSSGPVYRFDLQKNALHILLAFAADLYAIPAILRNKPIIAPKELKRINTDSVSLFDQWALQQDASRKDHFKKVSDWFLRGSIASFLLLLLDKKMRADAGKLFLLYANAQAVAYTIYTFSPLGPSYQNKYRPVVYYDAVPDGERQPGNNRNSQYSGHTGNAAAAAFFLAKSYSDYHSELSKRSLTAIYSLAALPAFIQGYLRIKALKHFPSDVLMAVVIGAICGVSIPEAYRLSKEQV